MWNKRGDCGAFGEVSDGLGPCLAQGVTFWDEDERGYYPMTARCDGCSYWGKTLEECLSKVPKEED